MIQSVKILKGENFPRLARRLRLSQDREWANQEAAQDQCQQGSNGGHGYGLGGGQRRLLSGIVRSFPAAGQWPPGRRTSATSPGSSTPRSWRTSSIALDYSGMLLHEP